MLKLKTTMRAPAIWALAAAAGALALAGVAPTAVADPVTACAPSGAAWDRASGSGDLVKMRATLRSIPGVCTQLLERAHARLNAVEARRAARVERPPAQHYQAPPPEERSASLGDVLNQIETELIAQGAVAWEGFAHDSNPQQGYQADWTYQKRIDATDFTYDTDSCDFDYHFKVTVDGKVSTDDDNAGIPLKDLTTIRISNLADVIKVRDAQNGHPTYSSHLQPTIYSVESIRNDGKLNEFDFYSLETAHRIGHLLQEASRKCGADPVIRE
ncbi:MAG TPA: hypothetical protein VN694_02280 [Caulobacteraceae bacterium]|nr:hypothetical protein [Caulobacteraceae bacterium]